MKHKFKMWTVVVSVLLFALTAPVKSEEKVSCEDIATNVALIMQLRQEGAAMDTVYNIFKESPVWQKVVIQAYEVPRYMVDSNRQREILRFKNEALLACYKSQ